MAAADAEVEVQVNRYHYRCLNEIDAAETNVIGAALRVRRDALTTLRGEAAPETSQDRKELDEAIIGYAAVKGLPR